MLLNSLRLTWIHARASSCQTRAWGQRRLLLFPYSTQLSRAGATAPLVLKSSQFPHLFEEGRTEAIYRSTPFHGLGHYQQGQLAQDWARRVLQEQNPESKFLDAAPGADCNGNRRSLHNAPYDFLMDGKRVEVKSGRLTWNSTMQVWCIRFWRIKQLEFDRLFLVLVCPGGLRLVQHDHSTGLCTDGKRTETHGHTVQVWGSKGDSSWQQAVETILFKLCENGACSLLARDHCGKGCLDDMLLRGEYSKTRTEYAYSGTALRDMSSGKRGLRIQEIGLAVDQILHPESHFTAVLHHPTAATRRRHVANAWADWSRDGRRVEVKSSSLSWDGACTRWKCVFGFIKPTLFHELWLAICSPLGVHFYVSDLSKGLNFGTCGTATEHQGLQVQFLGPRNEADPLKALLAIEAKIISKECELVAMVHWEQGRRLGG